MRKIFLFLILICVGISSSYAAEKIKNVIFMIPDGTGVSSISLARWYNGGSLYIDELYKGMIKTYSSNSIIGDSAPCGSTYANGILSEAGFVGVRPLYSFDKDFKVVKDEVNYYAPYANIMEAAKRAGKKTGIVVTCYFSHATPADFSAHTNNRYGDFPIASQMAFNDIDLVFGGGTAIIDSNINIPEYGSISNYLSKTGNKIVRDIRSMNSTSPKDLQNGKKLWGMFAPMDLPFEIDRDPALYPSLADMTAKALDNLDKSSEGKGFVAMIEGSKVDWAAHGNDPGALVKEIISFDNAVKVALDFAKKNKNTIIIICPDHSTGGLTIGSAKTTGSYQHQEYDSIISPLKSITSSFPGFVESIKGRKFTAEEFGKALNEKFGVKNASPCLYCDKMDMINGYLDSMNNVVKMTSNPYKATKLNEKFSRPIEKLLVLILKQQYDRLDWTTGGHTGEDVILGVYNPNGYQGAGYIKNVEVNQYAMKESGLQPLDKLTDKLFVAHDKLFPGAKFTITPGKIEDFPTLKIEQNGKTIEVFSNTNLFRVNGKEFQKMEISAVYIKERNLFYLPISLVKAIQK